MRLIESTRAWARRVKKDGVTLWFASRHPLTPWYAKALVAFVVAYALSPIDLIPDFIPVLGYLDDVILMPVLIWLAVKLLPQEVLAESRAKADAWMASSDTRPRSRVGALAVVVVWLLVAGALLLWLVSAMTQPGSVQRGIVRP